METKVSVYPVSEIPNSSIASLERDYDDVSAMLSVAPYIEEAVDEEDFLLELDNYPAKVEADVVIPLFRLRAVLSEQLLYKGSDFEGENVKVFFVVAEINKVPYGGVFIFVKGEEVLMQGISKFLVPFLEELRGIKVYPKLNDLLQPVIESFVRKLGATKISVKPIGKQKDILVKYHGYHQVNDILWYPSKNIKGRIGGRVDYLVKEL